MVDVGTFLTASYVMVDDFCYSHSTTPKKPGPQASLSASDGITLAIFTRWGHQPGLGCWRTLHSLLKGFEGAENHFR